MLTPAQLQTLKTHISNNTNQVIWLDVPTAINQLPNTDDANFAIASWYNQLASPSFYVWRNSVSIDEIMQNGFDWTRVDNLTVGKARIWDWMKDTGVLFPNQTNVRAGILAVFGTAGDLAMRQAIFNHCQKIATNSQKLFSTGSGTSTTEQGTGPATMQYELPLNYSDVTSARDLP